MKALVTGAAGQLGLEISRCFARDAEVVALTRAELDVVDHAAVLAAIRSARPDVVVNCAAYNDVDGAETDPVTAMAVNGFAVRSLATAARETGDTGALRHRFRVRRTDGPAIRRVGRAGPTKRVRHLKARRGVVRGRCATALHSSG